MTSAVAFVLLSARSTLADHYRVPTGSMLPTVEISDRIVVNKAAYGLRVPFTDDYATHFEGPQIGDVVVLRSPEDGDTLLKRVVAIPGTTIEVRELYFNTPARRKFLKSEQTELGHCIEMIRRAALARPDVAISVMHNGRALEHWNASEPPARVARILGEAFANAHLPLVDLDGRVVGEITPAL